MTNGFSHGFQVVREADFATIHSRGVSCIKPGAPLAMPCEDLSMSKKPSIKESRALTEDQKRNLAAIGISLATHFPSKGFCITP